jgi:hypothetical protein
MSDVLSSASLLTAIIGALYALWFNEIVEALKKEIPKHAANRVKPRREVGAVWLTRALPLAAASLSIALVFLPPTVALFGESWLRYKSSGLPTLHTYDPIATSFCLVELLSLGLAVDCLLRLLRLGALYVRLGSTLEGTEPR